MRSPTIREMKRRKEQLAATVRCQTSWRGTLALKRRFKHPFSWSDSCGECLPVFSPYLYPEESKGKQSKSQQAAQDTRVRPPVVDAGPLQGQQ